MRDQAWEREGSQLSPKSKSPLGVPKKGTRSLSSKLVAGWMAGAGPGPVEGKESTSIHPTVGRTDHRTSWGLEDTTAAKLRA
jgi:hypothetical protein